MASNVGEMSGMKDARHMILWLFFGLLPMLGSCDFRDMLDDYPVSGVQIKLDWKGVTDKLPQTMRIIFYPKDTQGRKVESYLPAGGGEVKVPPGKYAVVAYNFNTESIQIRGYQLLKGRRHSYHPKQQTEIIKKRSGQIHRSL